MADNALSGSGIWALAGKPTVALQDPNDQLNKLIGTRRQVLGMQNDLAQQARGEALQQSINPLNGQVDFTKANNLMAGDSRAAMAMSDALNQQQTVSTSQNNLSQSRNNYMGSALGSLNKLPDNQLHDGAANMIGDAVDQGLLDRSTGMRMLARMPSDPAQARQHLQQLQIGTMPAGAGREAIYGAPGTLSRGGTTEFGIVAPADQGGGFTPNSSTSMTLTPGERTTPQQIGTAPNGAPIYGTRQQYIDRTGGDPGATGGGALGDGRFPAALRNPNRAGAAAPPGAPGAGPAAAPGGPPAAMPATAPNAALGGGIVMGPGPAQTAAMTRQGGDSAGAFQSINDQGVQARSQSATLGTMLADTANFTPGVAWNEWGKSYVKNAPSWAPSFGVTPESVASLESFDKFANQLAQGQGAGSDARLAVAQGANPSSKMSKEGVDQVLRQLQGNADYLQARSRLAAQHPDQADVRGFEATTGAQLDPRAFQVYRMTPAQRQTYDRSLSKEDRSQVEAAYNFAHERGLFTAPAAVASPPPAAVAAPARPPVYIPPAAQRQPAVNLGGALRGSPAVPPSASPGNALRGY